MIPSPSSRRAMVDRWIVSLRPLFTIVAAGAAGLGLGTPTLEVGPSFLKKSNAFDADRVRRGSVWWIKGVGNVGFHVDFSKGGVRIEAWTGKDRHASVWISGKITEDTLARDLKVVLIAAGLTDMVRTEKVRASLMSARNRKGKKALDET